MRISGSGIFGRVETPEPESEPPELVGIYILPGAGLGVTKYGPVSSSLIKYVVIS